MINISKHFDSDSTRIYSVVDAVTSSMGVQYLVVGATARNLVLHYGYAAKIGSETSDVDFGIQLESWKEFDDVKNKLLDCGYETDLNRQHRLVDKQGLQIDIVPF